MLHETSIGDGKEVFLQKNKKKKKNLHFTQEEASSTVFTGVLGVPPSTSTTTTNCPTSFPVFTPTRPTEREGERENFSQKKGSRKFQVTFLGQKSVENGQLYHCLDVRKSQERQASKKFYNKCSENSRSLIVFRTDIFRKLTLGAPV